MINPRAFSFGSTSAVVTSMGLIIGLGTATAQVSTIVSALLIVGVADNISDSLSIHMYQEAEKLEERAAFRTTLAKEGAYPQAVQGATWVMRPSASRRFSSIRLRFT